jgi:hypothetical protein
LCCKVINDSVYRFPLIFFLTTKYFFGQHVHKKIKREDTRSATTETDYLLQVPTKQTDIL